MANLLPQDKKKEIRKEYRTRFYTVLLCFSGGVLIVAAILLFSLYVLMNGRLSGLNQKYEAYSEKGEDTVKIEESIKNINTKLELLQNNNLQSKIPYGVLKEVIDIKPGNIFLTKIAYSDNKQVIVGGVASYRKDLQDFIVAIEKDKMFLPVEYPFSNITQKEDIEFSLVINMKTDNEK
jgi:hypothetical protein